MITEALLGAIFGCIQAVLDLVPSVSLPTPDILLVGTGLAWQLDGIAPIRSLILATIAVFAVMLALTLWDFGVWVFHQFWGAS